MDRGKDFFVVRKGNTVAVYKNLSDCQSQISPSVFDPAVSAYKGFHWTKEMEDHFFANGLRNPQYCIDASELKEDLFGTLVPCSLPEICAAFASQQAAAAAGATSSRKQIDLGYPEAAQTMFFNHEPVGSSQVRNEHAKKSVIQAYPCDVQGFYKQEGTSNPSVKSFPDNLNLGHPVNAQPISQQHMLCILEFDGASKGNPGKSGAGAVLRTEDGRVISRLREGLGVVTNNVAEYRAVILGLRYALMKGFKRIKVKGDSKLVCSQVQGVWQTKHKNMIELCKEVHQLKEKFIYFEIAHIAREWNADADRQANFAINLPLGEVSEERGEAY